MSGEVISLNVGGVIFTTTITTLTQYPNSMLAAMFDTESERPPARKDGQGNFFIDRDPEPFRVILSFLRSTRLSEVIVGCTLEQLEWEADFFGLEELLKIIRERQKAEEEERKKAERESPLECMEKAAEIHKKSADLRTMIAECPKERDHPRYDICGICSNLVDSVQIYEKIATEYESRAADLRRSE